MRFKIVEIVEELKNVFINQHYLQLVLICLLSVIARSIWSGSKPSRKLVLEVIYLPLLTTWLAPTVAQYINPVILPVFAVFIGWVGLDWVINQVLNFFKAKTPNSKTSKQPNDKEQNKTGKQ